MCTTAFNTVRVDSSPSIRITILPLLLAFLCQLKMLLLFFSDITQNVHLYGPPSQCIPISKYFVTLSSLSRNFIIVVYFYVFFLLVLPNTFNDRLTLYPPTYPSGSEFQCFVVVNGTMVQKVFFQLKLDMQKYTTLAYPDINAPSLVIMP